MVHGLFSVVNGENKENDIPNYFASKVCINSKQKIMDEDDFEEEQDDDVYLEVAADHEMDDGEIGDDDVDEIEFEYEEIMDEDGDAQEGEEDPANLDDDKQKRFSGTWKKTPEQVEILEDLFKVKTYPVREEMLQMVEKTGLLYDQVTAWFNNRRQKAIRDECMELAMSNAKGKKKKKEPQGPSKVRSRKKKPSSNANLPDELVRNDSDSEATELNEEAKELAKIRFLENLLIWARDKLPVPYRPDGPGLSITFDDPPQGRKRKRNVGASRIAKKAKVPKEPKLTKKQLAAQRRVENEERRKEERMQRELQKAQAKIARKQELDEKKEAKIQRAAQREMDKERKEKEKEKKEREKEERLAKREEEKEALRLLKEAEKEEARLAREELAREKKARDAERLRLERLEARIIPDDEELERKELAKAILMGRRKQDQEKENGVESKYIDEGQNTRDDDELKEILDEVELPAFPPKSIEMVPLFDDYTILKSNNHLQARCLTVWSFLNCFGKLIGYETVTFSHFLSIINKGDMCDPDFVKIHTALVRCAVGDIDEVESIRINNGFGTFDNAYPEAQQTWEEGWKWGFDVNTWRAHINVLAWPEILRQWACACGLGRRRPKHVPPDFNFSNEAEKVAKMHDKYAAKVPSDLRLPDHIEFGSEKHAIWLILACAGAEGMHTDAIAKKIVEDLQETCTSAYIINKMKNDNEFVKRGPSRFCLRYWNQDNMEQDEKEDKSDDDFYGRAWVLSLETMEFCDMPLSLRIDAMEDVVNSAVDGILVRYELDERYNRWEDMKRELIQKEVEAKDKLKLEALETAKMEGPKQEIVAGQSLTHANYGKKEMESNKMDMEGVKISNGDVFEKSSPIIVKKEEAHLQEENGDSPANDETKGTKKTNNKITNKSLRDIQNDCAKESMLFHRIREQFLGEDRRCNKYWRFLVENPKHVLECKDGTKEDSSAGRIFVQKRLITSPIGNSNMMEQEFEDVPPTFEWYVIDTEVAFDSLLCTLDKRGKREKKLLFNLKFHEKRIKSGMRTIEEAKADSTPASRGNSCGTRNYRGDLKVSKQLLLSVKLNATVILNRGSRFNIDEDSSEKDYKQEDDLRIRYIKRSLKDIEAAIPIEAVTSSWSSVRKAWLISVTEASSMIQLRNCLGKLEGCVKSDWISEYYTGSMRQPAHPPPLKLLSEEMTSKEYTWTESSAASLEWLPPTIAGLSLRMLSLDTSLTYKEGHYMARELCSAYNHLSRFDDLTCLLQWDAPSKTKQPVKRDKSSKKSKYSDMETNGFQTVEQKHVVPTSSPLPIKRPTTKIVYTEPESDVEEIIEYETPIQDGSDQEYFNAVDDDDEEEEEEDDFSMKMRQEKANSRKGVIDAIAVHFDEHDDEFD